MALTRAELMQKLASNPRFKKVEKSGNSYVIPGAKPQNLRKNIKHPNRSPLDRSIWAATIGMAGMCLLA
jgi:hypothetical protein